MITLKQIKLLEAKVIKAVELISTLQNENSTLKGTLDSSQEKMKELENLVSQFKNDQNEIEQSVLRVLDNLDKLEDQLAEPPQQAVSEESESTPADDSKKNKGQELEIF